MRRIVLASALLATLAAPRAHAAYSCGQIAQATRDIDGIGLERLED